MESFRIGGFDDNASLEFLDRNTEDTDRLSESFRVRLIDHDLTASLRVYAWDFFAAHPASFFDEMAKKWKGWSGELILETLERNLCLRSEQDKLGHVTIRVELRHGPMDTDWSAAATIRIEAGELESIARRAGAFFERHPPNI